MRRALFLSALAGVLAMISATMVQAGNSGLPNEGLTIVRQTWHEIPPVKF